MLRRLLPPLLVLLALALPSGAGAAIEHFSAPPAGDNSVTPKEALRKAEAAVSGRAGQGREVTPLLKDLAVKLPALDGADRKRARRLLARPTLGETATNEDGYTVGEHNPPLCSAHFCIHWVDSTADAPPSIAYVQTMSQVFENVYSVENGQLGWRAPTSDGSSGCPGRAADCMNKTDVYIKNVGGQGVYGYSAPDPGQGRTLSQHAYLVMDNDFSAAEFPKYGGDPLQPMEVTAAHEYNHVLQFGYDVAQDTWMLESTAVWMEDKVYTDINDYLQYITPWTQLSFVPLTTFNSNRSDDPVNVKVYGDTVWNRWLDTKFGQDSPRVAWEHSLTSKPKSFAPGAYDQMLKGHGSSFFSAFSQFAADTAEWRSSNSPFSEGSTFPDMQRVLDSTDGRAIQLKINSGGAGGKLEHTTFGLVDVAPNAGPRVKAVLNSPRGVETAVALVGRIGDETSGTYVSAITRMPKGGPGSVTLTDPGRFSRITAVLINGDGRTTGRFSRTLQDWEWVGDGASVTARASTDYTPPKVRKRSPGARQTGVSRRPTLRVNFSERMMNVGTRTVLLLGPGGHKVKAKVKLTSGRKLQLKPTKRLRAGTRYTVRLSRDLEDLGANQLTTSARTWSFRTGH
jgi:hypothetical protein